tara:strand:- start:4369 stop:5415 length:1047 start_codon:yes stop_codon:yes gene_type:complete
MPSLSLLPLKVTGFYKGIHQYSGIIPPDPIEKALAIRQSYHQSRMVPHMERIRRLLKYAYFPLMFLGFNGVAIALVQAQVAYSSLWILMAVALFVSFTIEHLIPYNGLWNRAQADGLRDSLHFVINESSNYAGVLLLPLLGGLTLLPSAWPEEWPFWGQLLLAVVVFDIGSTLFHWLSHKSPLFWRFHAIHHAPKRLYGFNGIMKHPVFQLMDALVALGPLVLIGIPQDVAVVLVFSIFVQLLIQHSNADMRTGPLRHVFASAEVHRFHHLKGQAGDVNFGLFFSFWDFALGTAYFEKRNAPLRSTDIGIGHAPHYPTDYWGQLKAPFQYRQKTSIRNGKNVMGAGEP